MDCVKLDVAGVGRGDFPCRVQERVGPRVGNFPHARRGRPYGRGRQRAGWSIGGLGLRAAVSGRAAVAYAVPVGGVRGERGVAAEAGDIVTAATSPDLLHLFLYGFFNGAAHDSVCVKLVRL